MIVKLLTEHHLEFLSLKGGYRGWSESTLVKMSNCWKSHAATQIVFQMFRFQSSQYPGILAKFTGWKRTQDIAPK